MPAFDTTTFSIAAGAIHVWQIDLRISAPTLATLRQTLSSEERRRADQFVFAVDRARFTAARGALRALLARYLKYSPSDMHFAVNAFGKPHLAAPEDHWLRFNVSHSGDYALIACARECDVGIDLEQRQNLNFRDVAKEFFSPEENRCWLQLPVDDRPDGFFRWWVHKEAYVKALGKGLSHSPAGYTIRFATGQAPIAEDRARRAGETPCEFHSLTPPPGYAGALAALGPIRSLVAHAFPLEPDQPADTLTPATVRATVTPATDSDRLRRKMRGADESAIFHAKSFS